MKRLSFILSALMLAAALMPFTLALAHGGEDHGDEPKAKPATASTNTLTKTVQTASSQYRVTLKQLPARLRAGEQAQFEIDTVEIIEGGFDGGLLPVEGAKVTADIKSARGEAVARGLETHGEGRAGAYGVHFTPESAGEYKILFTIALGSGASFTSEFPFSVERAPINYRWYGAASAWLLLLGGFGFYRLQRVRARASEQRAGMLRTALPEYLVLLPIIVIGLILIKQLTVLPADTPAAVSASGHENAGNIIRIDKESQLIFGIKTEAAALKQISGGLRVNGVVRARPQSRSSITIPVTGLVRLKRALKIGDLVEKGDALLTLEQAMSVSDQIALETYKFEQRTRKTLADDEAEHSRQRLVAANVELARVRKLYEAGAVPLKQLQEAEQKMQFAVAEAAHAQTTRADLQGTLKDPQRLWTLPAPITGIVAAIDFVNGEQAEAGKSLITIVDLSKVWIEAQVFEPDLRSVLSAQRASYRAPVLGAEIRTVTAPPKGSLFTLGTSLNQSTRTLPVYFEVENKGRLLREGMAVEVSIDTTGNRSLLSVPRQAVVDEQGRQVVFVYKGGEQFEKRVVKANATGLADTEIVSGLKAGERVVVAGIYQLRASTGK